MVAKSGLKAKWVKEARSISHCLVGPYKKVSFEEEYRQF
jgi:hypothetical protein